jgi:hypothetical protein
LLLQIFDAANQLAERRLSHVHRCCVAPYHGG